MRQPQKQLAEDYGALPPYWKLIAISNKVETILRLDARSNELGGGQVLWGKVQVCSVSRLGRKKERLRSKTG